MMRWAFLAASVALSALAPAYAQDNKPAGAEPAAQRNAVAQPVVDTGTPPASDLIVTSPPNADPARTYADPEAALVQADIDYLIREARRSLANNSAQEQVALWTFAVFADDFAAGRYTEARATLSNAPGGLRGGLANMLEPFLFAAEGQVDRGVERVGAGNELPQPLPDVARALVFESAGRLNEAAAVYAQMIEGLDLTPPPDAEPRNLEEFERALNAARITHSVYRAALVFHRLGRTEEARRYYNVVMEFAPRSEDVQQNLRRLDAGQQPFEPALTPRTAAGRWMIFLSEFVTQAEMLAGVMSSQDPTPGLASVSGTALLQIGLLLAPDASDWRLYAAQQLVNANGNDGAERILALMPADDVFTPDSDILRAGILIRRDDDAGAVAAAERAAARAGERWTMVAATADIYRQANRPAEAIATYDRALAMATDAEDRADILSYRAYANRFNGNLPAAVADMRQALEIDQSVDTRFVYVSILMDGDAGAWRDGIQVARGLFAEQPDSVLRLNALGYALIQRPEGLEEGYRLLWRGFNFGQQNYAVVDSLGWAYYLYGHFDEARALIERANSLNVEEPNAEILDHLGDVYWRLNRRDDARTQWRAALAADPDAIRRRSLEQKLSRGLTEPAPRRRELPQVDLPDRPAQQDDL
jgi:tetratricopeptide (TPR) repeat protein